MTVFRLNSSPKKGERLCEVIAEGVNSLNAARDIIHKQTQPGLYYVRGSGPDILYKRRVS